MTTTDLTATGSGALDDAATTIELTIGGMTCASCSARIEKKLNKIDGVTATVNFAMESAKVAFIAPITVEDLISAVEEAGYTAAPPPPPTPAPLPGAPRRRPSRSAPTTTRSTPCADVW